MKKNRLFFAVLFTAAIGLVFWRLFVPHNRADKYEPIPQTTISQPRKSAQATAASAVATVPPMPRLFKMKGYPPTTPEHKAMWDWWSAMEKADPKFQWKTPIQFYGKVIDQFGNPVSGATAHIVWTAIDDSHETNRMSGADGKFEFGGERGKSMTVDVSKGGYLPAKGWIQNFDYIAFFEDTFLIPDKNSPVIFRLQKLMGAEPMLKFVTNSEVILGEPNVSLDAETGKLGTVGDLSFGIISGAKGQYGPDYSITISAMDGAAFAFSEEEFLFKAPETGYRTAAVFNRLSSEPNFSRVQPYRLYVKTRSGKYSAVTGEITIREGLSEGKAGFHAIIYHNPSGSRNLEFDHRKWLNR